MRFLLRCPKNGAGMLPHPILPFFDRGDSLTSFSPLRGARIAPQLRHTSMPHYCTVCDMKKSSFQQKKVRENGPRTFTWKVRSALRLVQAFFADVFFLEGN